MNKPNNLKHLIVGTGRSGTGYISQLLTLNGIPCGHEDIFSPWSNTVPDGNEFLAEASWLGVPHIKDYKNLQVYHVVRNPVKVVASWMNKNNEGIWGNVKVNRSGGISRKTSPYWKFVEHHLPEISKIKTPLEATIYYVVEWSRKIKEEVGDSFYRLETDCVQMLRDMGIDNPQIFKDIYYNRKQPAGDRNKPKDSPLKLKHSDITGQYREMLIQHTHEYGYVTTLKK